MLIIYKLLIMELFKIKILDKVWIHKLRTAKIRLKTGQILQMKKLWLKVASKISPRSKYLYKTKTKPKEEIISTN